jgi:pimeloyl-ACP methyl ester carboxylesterase
VKKIPLYIFSGLGVDERVFQRIRFPENVEVHFIKWQPPARYSENLDDYIDRIIAIEINEPVILIGLSFGGIVAQQLAKKIKPLQTIIISSISCPAELPWYFKLYGRLYLDRVTPFRLFKFPNFLTNWIFGAESKDDKELLQQIIRESDNRIIRWSVKQVLNWKGASVPVFHIHGTKDKLLPLKNKNADAIIAGGGHFMVYNKAEDVELVIESVLTSLRFPPKKRRNF